MPENPQTPSLVDDLPDDIPLGNSDPLLVPTPLGQPFLQPKFIYPLGAVSIINPDSLSAESDFEPLSDSFNESPFFDHPLQKTESVAPSIVNSQPNLQAKPIKSSPQSVKRSPQVSPQNTLPRDPATSSPLIIPSNSPSLPTSQTEIQTSMADSSQANNSSNLQYNSSDQQSSLSEALNKSDVSSDFSEDISIQRFPDIASNHNDVTPVIGDSSSSVTNIENSIPSEVPSNQSYLQLIQREHNNFDSDSSNTIFADNSPAITSLQESEPSIEDVTSIDNSDIPNIQSKSASQDNARSDISGNISKDISLNNNSPSIQRTSELSHSSQEVLNQDYGQNIQPSTYNIDTASPVKIANTVLDNDVDSEYKTDTSSSIQREVEISNNESSNDLTNNFPPINLDSINQEYQVDQNLNITESINNSHSDDIQRDLALSTDTNLTKQVNIDNNISNQTSQDDLVDNTNQNSNQILESSPKTVSNNKQIENPTIQRNLDELSGINSPDIVTPTVDRNIDLPNTIINAPNVDSSEQRLQRQFDETSDNTSTNQTISQSLQDASNQLNIDFSSTSNTDTKIQNNYSDPNSSNTSTSIIPSIINDTSTQIQANSNLEDIPNRSSLPIDVTSDRDLEVLPIKEVSISDINTSNIPNESLQSSITPSGSENYTIQRSINNQEFNNNTNNEISGGNLNEHLSQNSSVNESSALIQRESDLDSTESKSDTNISNNTSIEQPPISNSSLDIASNSSLPTTSNSAISLDVQSKTSESNQNISGYQGDQSSSNNFLQKDTSSNIGNIINRNISQENISKPNSDVNTEIISNNPVNNLLSRKFDLGSDEPTNDSKPDIEDIHAISSTKNDTTEDIIGSISQANPVINTPNNNFNDAFTANPQNNIQRDSSDTRNIDVAESAKNTSIQRDPEISISNSIDINRDIYGTFPSIKGADNSDNNINTQADSIIDSNVDQLSNLDSISTIANQNIQLQADNAYKSDEALTEHIQNYIQRDTSNIRNLGNIDATQIQRNSSYDNIDLANINERSTSISQDTIRAYSPSEENVTYNNESTNLFSNIDSEAENSNNLNDPFIGESQNIQRQLESITVNDSVINSTSVLPELSIQRESLNSSLPNTSSNLLDTSISNNENNNIQLEAFSDSISISELKNSQDQLIASPIDSSSSTNTPSRNDIVTPSDRLNNQLQRQIELSDVDAANLSADIEDADPRGMNSAIPDDLLQMSRQESPDISTAKLDTSNTDNNYPSLQTQFDGSSLSPSSVLDSDLSRATEDINRNIIQSDSITLATDNIINRKADQVDAVNNNNLNGDLNQTIDISTNKEEQSVQREEYLEINENINGSNVNSEYEDSNTFDQVSAFQTIQPTLDIVSPDNYLDRDLPSFQDPNVVELTQNNSSQEIPQNSLNNISNEQIQRSYELNSIPSSELVESDSSLPSSSESSFLNEDNLSPTNLEGSDSYVVNNTNSNSNVAIDSENSLGNREQNIQRKSETGNPSQNTNISNLDARLLTNDVSSLELGNEIQRQVDLDNGRTVIDKVNNTDSDRNLDVQDAIALFGVNEYVAEVSELPIAQSSSQSLQREIDSSIDFNEIDSINTSINTKDVDIRSISHIENISADITKDTQNIQRDPDISPDPFKNKIDSTENIGATSQHPSVTAAQSLVQTSDTSLINRKLDSGNQGLSSQDLRPISTDNIVDDLLQRESIQLRNSNDQQSSESTSSNTSIKLSENISDYSLNESSQVLPLNPVEDDNVVQLQQSLQESNAVVDPINTSLDVDQAIQPKLDIAASDKYLDRDLTNLQDAAHYNIAETPQSNSLGRTSQDSLDNVSGDQLQRSYESTSIPSNEVLESNYGLPSSSESSLLNEYNLNPINLEVSDSYVENNTNISTVDASLSTNDVASLELGNAIQRQVVLDSSRTDVDIKSNTASDRNLDTKNEINSFTVNEHIVEKPDLPHKITEPSQNLQRAIDLTQTVNAEFKGDTQEDLGTFNSDSNQVVDIISRKANQNDVAASQNLIQTSDTSIINRKLDNNVHSLESQDLRTITSIDDSETIINGDNSQTENTLQNSSQIGDNYSQNIQLSNNSDYQNINANINADNQDLTNDISADNNSQAIQAKLDIPNPELKFDSNIDTNLESSYDNNLASTTNDPLVQKSPNSSQVYLEESSSVDTNVLDNHSINLQLSSQENIQKVLDESIPSNSSSQSIDISDQEVKTIDTSTGLSSIQKGEIDAKSQLIQRKAESANSESIPLENLGNAVQAKTANAIATSNNQIDQTVIQRLSAQENADDLNLPTVLQNLGQTDSLSNFTPLTNNQFNNHISSQSTSPHSSQLLQAKSNSSTFSNTVSNSGSTSNPINSLSTTPTRIQPKADPTNQGSSPQVSHDGWSNIAELLANLPPPKVSSNPSTSSLNKKSVSSSDRSSLASNPKPSQSTSSQTTSSQTVIQRSLDDSDDGDLYITPAGLQRGNPNQSVNSQSNTIQRQQMPSADASLPEATVKVDSHDDRDNDANFEENLNALAQEIYVLLRQRLEIEKERQGSRYQGRLPW